MRTATCSVVVYQQLTVQMMFTASAAPLRTLEMVPLRRVSQPEHWVWQAAVLDMGIYARYSQHQRNVAGQPARTRESLGDHTGGWDPALRSAGSYAGYFHTHPPDPSGSKATSPAGVVTSKMTRPFSFSPLPM